MLLTDDGDDGRRLLGGDSSLGATRDQHLDAFADQFLGEDRQPVIFPVRGPDFERQVGSLDIALLAERLAQPVEIDLGLLGRSAPRNPMRTTLTRR
jgi:hypothetical protein